MSFTCPECKRVSHHPDDERYGYCGNCHSFTGDRELIFKLTRGEMKRAEAIATEALNLCNAIRNMFPTTTRGMMTFMYALSILKREYSALFTHADIADGMVAQWIAAGEPEQPSEVVGRIYERVKKERENGEAETAGEQ